MLNRYSISTKAKLKLGLSCVLAHSIEFVRWMRGRSLAVWILQYILWYTEKNELALKGMNLGCTRAPATSATLLVYWKKDPPQGTLAMHICTVLYSRGGISCSLFQWNRNDISLNSHMNSKKQNRMCRVHTGTSLPSVCCDAGILKGAQVWKFSSHVFFLFFYHKASMGRRL